MLYHLFFSSFSKPGILFHSPLVHQCVANELNIAWQSGDSGQVSLCCGWILSISLFVSLSASLFLFPREHEPFYLPFPFNALRSILCLLCSSDCPFFGGIPSSVCYQSPSLLCLRSACGLFWTHHRLSSLSPWPLFSSGSLKWLSTTPKCL